LNFFFNFQNSDAYLLFYKRRTCRPLGGKTHSKIEAARLNSEPSSVAETPVPVPINEQLPTPPEEPLAVSSSRKQDLTLTQTNHNWTSSGRWQTPQSESSSITTSPPPLDEADSELPPSFSDSQFDAVLEDSLEPLVLSSSSNQYEFGRTSPTSSNEVEVDSDDEPSGNLGTDSRQGSPVEEMLRDAQEGVDTWNN
jgi:ubiquitin carboxyl-terminal hydrolase 4/11